jgi:hypothetical protein
MSYEKPMKMEVAEFVDYVLASCCEGTEAEITGGFLNLREARAADWRELRIPATREAAFSASFGNYHEVSFVCSSEWPFPCFRSKAGKVL